ncbi:MAG: hypothetical protein WDO19_11895 [Bacteroidota bacterium]
MMLHQMAEIIQKTGGKFIVLNLDNGYKKSEWSEILDQDTINNHILKEVSNTDALVLPVSAAIDFSRKDLFVPNDGHPAALANKMIAGCLFKNLQQKPIDSLSLNSHK